MMKAEQEQQVLKRQKQLTILLRYEEKNSNYKKLFLAWDKLERSNKPGNFTDKTKKLSKNARNLLPSITYKIKRDGVAFLNHKYISTITECARRQNLNIIREMEYLFDIKFHRSLNFQNRKLSNVYSFVYKTHETEHRKKITSSIAEKRKEEPEFKGSIIENNIEYRSISKINCVKNNKKTKELRDMLKIMDENICQQIIKKSGKYNFTNECVKKITEKMMNKPDVSPKFYSLKGFVYYMAKCLKRELCNPKKILSKSFEYSVKMTQKENFQIKEHKIPSDLFGQIRKKLIKLYGEREVLVMIYIGSQN